MVQEEVTGRMHYHKSFPDFSWFNSTEVFRCGRIGEFYGG